MEDVQVLWRLVRRVLIDNAINQNDVTDDRPLFQIPSRCHVWPTAITQNILNAQHDSNMLEKTDPQSEEAAYWGQEENLDQAY